MEPNSLEKIDKGLWCLSSHFMIWGCRGSLRMTLVETTQGLLLYSPVSLAPAHIEQIRRLGDVAAIIAPNLFHQFYLRACIEAFPAAQVFVPNGLEEKIGPIPGATVMARGFDLGFGDELETYVFAEHKIRETVLFHKPTGTLITADLLYNYQPEHYRAEKLFFRMIGCYGEPTVAFYHRYAIKNKSAVQPLVETVRRWHVRRIIMCHGRIVEDDGASDLFAKAWAQITQ
jgi:Domain of unknown function (DUF4336)